MLRFFRKNYVCWGDYKARIDFFNTINWQQCIRRDNLKAIETYTL